MRRRTIWKWKDLQLLPDRYVRPKPTNLLQSLRESMCTMSMNRQIWLWVLIGPSHHSKLLWSRVTTETIFCLLLILGVSILFNTCRVSCIPSCARNETSGDANARRGAGTSVVLLVHCMVCRSKHVKTQMVEFWLLYTTMTVLRSKINYSEITSCSF